MSTGIEWTEETWNPATGCRKVSPGCDNCYAARRAARLKGMGDAHYQNDGPDGPGFGLALHPDRLAEPLRWRRPRRIFVNSMSDLFHADVPDDFILAVFRTMQAAARHSFQVLTKRPQRMAKVARQMAERLGVLPNVRLGVTIETDEYVWRADYLREAPAWVRFLSLEPLLGPLPSLELRRIDWAIVGGESGPGFRPMAAEWVRDLRDRCIAADVAFFFKQWAGVRTKALGRELDGRIWSEYPREASRAPAALWAEVQG